MDFVQKRSDPPPPQNFVSFVIFWNTFPKVKTFGTFATLLCILIHPLFWQKSVPKHLDFVKPLAPFLPKIPNKLVHKKFPNFFGLLFNPPLPPFMDKVQIKATLFLRPSPRQHSGLICNLHCYLKLVIQFHLQ